MIACIRGRAPEVIEICHDFGGFVIFLEYVTRFSLETFVMGLILNIK